MAYEFDEELQRAKKPRSEATLKYIQEINRVLDESKEPLKIKQIYELLLKKGAIEVDHYKHFRRYLEAGVQDGLINDLSKIKSNKEKKKIQDEFTKEQMIKLFDSIDNPRTAMECLISFYQALRINEAANLMWEDFDMENLQVSIRHGKGGIDNQKVLIPKELVNIINMWREYCGGSDYFIPNRIGTRGKCEYKSIHRDFRKSIASAGLNIKKEVWHCKNGVQKKISKYVFHTLRRTRLTFLHRYEGWSLRQVQVFARHRNSTTTEGYINVADHELRSLLDKEYYRFQKTPNIVADEPSPQLQLELLKELNRKKELEIAEKRLLKELKELELNLNHR